MSFLSFFGRSRSDDQCSTTFILSLKAATSCAVLDSFSITSVTVETMYEKNIAPKTMKTVTTARSVVVVTEMSP